jgi:hypothetical protein
MTTKTKTTSVTIRVLDANTGREREVKFFGHSFTAAWDAASAYLANRPYLSEVQLAEEEDWDANLVHCSICDGIGHGQPGYGPCPLEDNGYFDPEEDAREREAQYWEDVRRQESIKAHVEATGGLYCVEHDCVQHDNGTGIDHDYCAWDGELPPTESEWIAWKAHREDQRQRDAFERKQRAEEASRCNTKPQAIRALHRAWND